MGIGTLQKYKFVIFVIFFLAKISKIKTFNREKNVREQFWWNEDNNKNSITQNICNKEIVVWVNHDSNYNELIGKNILEDLNCQGRSYKSRLANTMEKSVL